jgi:hypothetical protein
VVVSVVVVADEGDDPRRLPTVAAFVVAAADVAADAVGEVVVVLTLTQAPSSVV